MDNRNKSEEDYLEKILMIKRQQGVVRQIDIAQFMNYSKPSVSVAIKKLQEKGYIVFDKKTGEITLTDKGIHIAESTLVKHDTLTYFLVNIGVRKDVAEEDACKIEHDLSDETFLCLLNYIKNTNL